MSATVKWLEPSAASSFPRSLDYHNYDNYLNIKPSTEKCKFIMPRAANKMSHDFWILARYRAL